MTSLTSALACATHLLSYTGQMPDVILRDRTPSQAECDSAIGKDRDAAWLRQEYGARPACLALTYFKRSDLSRFWIVMPADSPWRVQLTEALRVVNAISGERLRTPEIYRLAAGGNCRGAI